MSLKFSSAILGVFSLIFLTSTNAQSKDSDLTIFVSGDLWKYGGVVTVYPMPIATSNLAADGTMANVVTLESRYSEIQLRYPENASYNYRFRPDKNLMDDPNARKMATQTLSVIGVDGEGRGPEMKIGFKGEFSSGGRIIRVLPYNEYADTTFPNWGETQGYNAKPPADVRSARSLVGTLQSGNSDQVQLECRGQALWRICTPAPDQEQKLEMRWWRAVAEGRLERLRHHALRRCYDTGPKSGDQCRAVDGSDEPSYE